MTNIKTFTVSLNKDVVKKAKELQKPQGGKLSPLINEFLVRWINNEQSKSKEKGL